MKLLLCFSAALLFCPSLATAQGSGNRTTGAERNPPGSGLPARPPGPEPSQRGVTGAVALEGRIDPAGYEVGPGDVFSITLGGPQPTTYTQTVTPEGYLVLPEAGSVPVAGFTLREARTRTLQAIGSRFQNVRAEVALTEPRRFVVHLSGAVPVRGRKEATAVTRVSDVLGSMLDDTEETPPTTHAFRPSLRVVQIRRQDGSTLSVDLLRYYATGDTRHNPYLRDGDVITVSSYDPAREAVFVGGAVPFPASYPYRPGDTAVDLLEVAGYDGGTSTGQVRLTRTQPDGELEVHVLDISDILAGTAEPAGILPLDHLFVIPPERLGGTATVEGAVAFPGTYPIEPGRTTIRDLVVKQGGGLRPEALARGAILLRTSMTSQEPRLDSTAASRRVRTAELDFLSRTYLQQELSAQDFVPINLTEALAENGSPLYLQDRDRVIVPRDDRAVYVFGQIARPGYVPFLPGRTAGDYVSLAGGTTGLATETWLVKAGTGQFQTTERGTIESGDAIFVDRRDVADTPALQQILLQEQGFELTKANNRREARYRALQTAFSVVGLVTGTYTTILLIRNRNGGN